MEKEPTQDELQKFVNNNVDQCQSSLVEHLLSNGVFSYDDIVNGYVYRCPECGNTQTEQFDFEADDENQFDTASTYKCYDCDKEFRDEPEYELQEIFEWWLCSDWLLDQLEARGEPILRTDYGSWWGRTCSGQSIMLDGVIADIYKAL